MRSDFGGSPLLNEIPAPISATQWMSENNSAEWESFENCATYILALFPQSSSPPICLCVCLVPPHVISPSGQPPHQTSLQAVPRCHPSI